MERSLMTKYQVRALLNQLSQMISQCDLSSLMSQRVCYIQHHQLIRRSHISLNMFQLSPPQRSGAEEHKELTLSLTGYWFFTDNRKVLTDTGSRIQGLSFNVRALYQLSYLDRLPFCCLNSGFVLITWQNSHLTSDVRWMYTGCTTREIMCKV